MTLSIDEGLALIDAQEQQLRQDSLSRTRVHVRDKNLEFVGYITGENHGRWEDICNDAGEASIGIPGEDPIAKWLIDEHVDADIFLVFETPWKRECYKVFDIDVEEDEHGIVEVTPHALHILDETKHWQCWPNTFAPLAVQAPKADTQWGPSIRVIKGYAVRNLWREQARGWIPHFDFWNKENWRANFNNADWQMVMVPPKPGDENSTWCALSSRMDNFYDMVAPTLDDAGLQLTADLWLPGDEQPAPDYFTLDRPTMVFDVVQRRPVPGMTGSILDPLRDLLRIFSSDGTSHTTTIADPNDDPDSVGPDSPWVIWRRGEHLGLRSKMTIHKPLEHTITTGGRSPDAINQGVKLLINGALGLLGTAIGLPGLGLGIFDKLVEDVILAWAIFTDRGRKERMGPFAHKSGFEAGGGVAISPSGLQTGRVGLWKARGYVSFAAEVDDMAPYIFGYHVDTGYSCGFEIGEKIWLSNIAAAEQAWSRTDPQTWTLKVGDYQAGEPPGVAALRQINTLTGAIRLHTSAI